MWALVNRTPYAAERTWVRDKQGQHVWLVAVKATYDVNEGGALQLAEKQEPPLLQPLHLGEPGQSSLRFDTDLVEQKPTTDVVINGSAHAPNGKPTETVEVILRFHGVEKTLLVHGPRTYWRSPIGLAPSDRVSRSWAVTRGAQRRRLKTAMQGGLGSVQPGTSWRIYKATNRAR